MGTVKCDGASSSSLRRSSQDRRVRSASTRGTPVRCSRRVMPSSQGESQVSTDPRSAASSTAGHWRKSSRARPRTNSMRACRSRASRSQGRAASPSSRTPANIALRAASAGTGSSGRSSSTSASNLTMRLAITASSREFHSMAVALTIRSAKCSIRSARASGAASRMRASRSRSSRSTATMNSWLDRLSAWAKNAPRPFASVKRASAPGAGGRCGPDRQRRAASRRGSCLSPRSVGAQLPGELARQASRALQRGRDPAPLLLAPSRISTRERMSVSCELAAPRKRSRSDSNAASMRGERHARERLCTQQHVCEPRDERSATRPSRVRAP